MNEELNGYRCHALRRVNPFRGVMQVVDSAQGRAVSADGVHWEVQLRVQLPTRWGYLNRDRVETGFCRYGGWSVAAGLARYATPPQLDRRAAETIGAELVAAVQASLPNLPFALGDTLECWQFDAERGKPLALLATLPPDSELPGQTRRRWQAVPMDAAPEKRRFADPVEACVARLRLPGLTWIARDALGGGRRLDDTGHSGDRQISPGDFPEILLALEWLTEAERVAYLDGLAPRLLMLPLATATRAQLERCAVLQPQLVERFHRLYPAIYDMELLTSIRVQARLMAAA